MHIERNLSNNVYKHLIGKKNTLATRKDMEEVRKTPGLHIRYLTSRNSYVKQAVPYVLTNSERISFLNMVSSTRVPSRYNSLLVKHIGEKKMASLKSHDYHTLIQ
jgi:hypothetical protein